VGEWWWEAIAHSESLCIVYDMRLSGSHVMYVYYLCTNGDNNIIIVDKVQDYCCYTAHTNIECTVYTTHTYIYIYTIAYPTYARCRCRIYTTIIIPTYSWFFSAYYIYSLTSPRSPKTLNTACCGRRRSPRAPDFFIPTH